jgi:hypothetical protein
MSTADDDDVEFLGVQHGMSSIGRSGGARPTARALP